MGSVNPPEATAPSWLSAPPAPHYWLKTMHSLTPACALLCEPLDMTHQNTVIAYVKQLNWHHFHHNRDFLFPTLENEEYKCKHFKKSCTINVHLFGAFTISRSRAVDIKSSFFLKEAILHSGWNNSKLLFAGDLSQTTIIYFVNMLRTPLQYCTDFAYYLLSGWCQGIRNKMF